MSADVISQSLFKLEPNIFFGKNKIKIIFSNDFKKSRLLFVLKERKITVLNHQDIEFILLNIKLLKYF